MFEPSLKTWSKLTDVDIPQNIEFNRAIVYENSIFLTGNHSYELFCLKPPIKRQSHNKGNEPQTGHKLELIGKFSTETHNVSLVGHEIFNFSTNQFEYISTIETYNLKTKEFKVVWEKETEEFDFSPYQPIACFPLVVF